MLFVLIIHYAEQLYIISESISSSKRLWEDGLVEEGVPRGEWDYCLDLAQFGSYCLSERREVTFPPPGYLSVPL